MARDAVGSNLLKSLFSLAEVIFVYREIVEVATEILIYLFTTYYISFNIFNVFPPGRSSQ